MLKYPVPLQVLTDVTKRKSDNVIKVCRTRKKNFAL